MKIALIHYKLVKKGGLETRLLNYIDQFVALGNQVSVFSVRIDSSIKLPPDVEIIKVKLGIVPNPFRKWYFNVKLGRIIRKQKFDFSLSLGRTSHQDAVLAPSNHLGYLKALGIERKGLLDYLQIYLDKKSYQKSKIVYAASSMMKEELIKLYGIDSAKIKVLYPPLDNLKFRRSSQQQSLDFKKKFGINPNKKSIVFVTTNMHLKGIGLLEDVFSKLDPNLFELFIAGKTTLSSRHENIKFLGYVGNIHELYAACDYLIHPSKFDGFGQIVSEALQSGLPVIISDKTGAKEIITAQLGIVVNGFDAEVWRELILNIGNHQFNIPTNFAEVQGLSVNQHTAKMLQLWEDISQ